MKTDCMNWESTEVTFLFAERKMYINILHLAHGMEYVGNSESFFNGLHETL